MADVVFLAPFLLEATRRFVDAVAALPGVRLGLLTQEPPDRVPAALRSRLGALARVEDGLDADRVEAGVRELAARLGGVDRLLGTLEQAQVPLARVRERLGLPGLGVEAAENFRDKARMKSVLRAAGLPCARHRLVADAAGALSFAEEVGFPIVVKPPAGAGAKATFRVDDAHDLGEAVAVAGASRGREVLLEEFVTGVEHSFDAVTLRGRPVWHSLSRYDPTPLDVLREPWIQWCVMIPREIDDPRYDDVRRAGFRALEVLGMQGGISHMEWFRRRDGSLAIGEIAARPPGAQFCTLISWAHDFDFHAAWARSVVFDAFDPPARRYAAGAAYLRGQGTGTVAALRGLEQAQEELGPLVVEARLPRIGQSPSGSYEGEGFVILRHESTEVVEKALRRLVSLVRVDMAPPGDA